MEEGSSPGASPGLLDSSVPHSPASLSDALPALTSIPIGSPQLGGREHMLLTCSGPRSVLLSIGIEALLPGGPTQHSRQ